MTSTAAAVKKHVGATVRKARLAADLTQVQLAKRARICQTHLSRIEAGDKAPSLGVLRRLAAVLDLSLDAMVA